MSLKGKQVLVIDDAPDSRMVCKKVLENLGITVTEAADVNEGLLKATDTVPHLVILDLQMPVHSGFLFLQARRQKDQLAPVPVIVASGLNDRASIQKAIALGANDYLIKPFSAARLTQKVRKHLRGQDFKTHAFAPDALPEITLEIGASVSLVEDTRFLISSPIRLAERSRIELPAEALQSLGATGAVLMTGDGAGSRSGDGTYLSWVNTMGITKSLLSQGKGKK